MKSSTLSICTGSLFGIVLIVFSYACNPFTNSDVNDCSFDVQLQLTPQERHEIAKSQLQTDEFTRWDTPWWEMSDEQMADSLRANNSEVIISFKEPNQIAGVDEQGNVLVSNQTKECGIDAIIELEAEILSKATLHPSVLAKIPVDPELISTIRNHPLVDIFEPNVRARYEI